MEADDMRVAYDRYKLWYDSTILMKYHTYIPYIRRSLFSVCGAGARRCCGVDVWRGFKILERF
jgi:hypothetical protein